MKDTSLGIYIHIPFCVKKCNYCDFCSYSDILPAERENYLSALCRHIASFENTKDRTVDTVYFGGGTPTLLTSKQAEKVIETVRSTFRVADNAEITFECNPGTVTKEYLKELYGLGVNRLSVGVQSFNDEELKALGRIHTANDAEKALDDAKNAGFENISADIMFGIPLQTVASFHSTLKRTAELGVFHVSAYGLILEPHTPFFENREKLALPDEDTEYSMYNQAVSYLRDHGLKRYEISNFAMNGYESRHNLKYWNRQDYLGFGVSAHSCFNETRFCAPNSVSEYINGRSVEKTEEISNNDAMAEYVMLGMRKENGIDENAFFVQFGVSFEKAYGKKTEQYVKQGFIVRDNDRCRFSDSGFYVSNTVLSDILDFDK